MIPNILLYPFRTLFSGYFNDDQLTSFLTGALTVGLLWMLTVLQECVPDNNEGFELDEEDLGFVDPWNDPLTYVSTQLQKHIGELPKRFKRKHWPWETNRRKVLGDESDEDSERDDFSASSFKANDSVASATVVEEKKDDDFMAASGDSNDNENNNLDTTKSDIAKKDEKQLCIGSIFGLDVGGTLAKLVYFEKKAPELDPFQTRSLREKHYVQAVSALHSNDPHEQFVTKRSTSMSPMRKFPNPIIGVNKVSGGVLRRRTAATAHTHTIKKQTVPLRRHEACNKNSSEDLKNMYAIRQDSLPDDVCQFQDSVGSLSNSSRAEETHKGYEVFGSNRKKDTGDTPNIVDDDENDSWNDPPESSLLASASTSISAPVFSNSMLQQKRSLSMLDLSAQHDRQKAEALNRFYDFARRLNTHEDSISDIQLSFYCRELGGEFHFISFETRKMKNAMDLIRFNNLHMNIRNMGATGGGAHKFADIWEQELGIGMIKQDELDSLVAGMQFVLSTVVGECFTFRPKEDPKADELPLIEDDGSESNTDAPQIRGGSSESKFGPKMNRPESSSNLTPKPKIYKLDRWTRKVQRDTISYSSAYPYMLVTIGTGVSVLRVDGPRKHERVSGSTIGGGTFWGLMRLLTDVENFEDAMKLAEKGDPTKVDMMVGDIYGEDSDALEKLGLAADIVASSFGKLVSKEDPARGLTQGDLARALLSLVTNNIGQVAYLNAKLHKTPRIYFVGSFLRHNMISQRRLAYAIDYWSKGEMEGLFLEHEGYFGALGAFLMTQNIEKEDGGFYQWRNNS